VWQRRHIRRCRGESSLRHVAARSPQSAQPTLKCPPLPPLTILRRRLRPALHAAAASVRLRGAAAAAVRRVPPRRLHLPAPRPVAFPVQRRPRRLPARLSPSTVCAAGTCGGSASEPPAFGQSFSFAARQRRLGPLPCTPHSSSAPHRRLLPPWVPFRRCLPPHPPTLPAPLALLCVCVPCDKQR
jgi:hypothetical protein